MTLSSTEAEYMEMSACAQEVNIISMLLGNITEVEKPSVIYEENQSANFLAKNRQVGICTKHIDICHHFLQEMEEEKDIDIQYIWSEENQYVRTEVKIISMLLGNITEVEKPSVIYEENHL